MTGKTKKAKQKKARPQPGRIAWLHASVEDDLLSLADEEGQPSCGSVQEKLGQPPV